MNTPASAPSVGIDVSKASLDVALGSEGQTLVFDNTPDGHARLLDHLRPVQQWRIVIEATGGYERVLVGALSAAGCTVVVVNPRQVRDFAKALGILAKTDRKWDAIAIDVFYEDGIPFHMSTFEFFELVREHLEPGGVVLMNVIGSIEDSGSELFRAMYRTYRAVFPTVVTHPAVAPGGGLQNLMVVATEQPAPTKSVLLDRWRETRKPTPTYPELRTRIRDRVDSGIEIEDVPTLTDDYAPTDALLIE